VRRERRVAGDARELDPGVPERDDRRDQLVAELRRALILEPGDERRPRRGCARHVAGLAAAGRQRDPGERGADRRRVLEQRVDRDRAVAEPGELRAQVVRRLAVLDAGRRAVVRQQLREPEPIVELVERAAAGEASARRAAPVAPVGVRGRASSRGRRRARPQRVAEPA
jgi:hypothetical protein